MKTIITERLILRGWLQDDINDLYEFAKDPNVSQIGGWKPHSNIDDSKAALKSYIENDDRWAVVLKTNNKVIGSIRIYKDENRGNFNAKLINFMLSAEHWGNGYMTEAIKSVVKYAFEEMNIDLLSAFHYPQNIRSKRVIEKCGFTYEGTIENGCKRYDGQTFDAVCYSILRSDYLLAVSKQKIT